MSKSIDEKVVALRFNNKEFDKGVDATLKRVDDLNKGLKLEGASKGLEKVADKADKIELSKLEISIDRVQAKISMLSQIAASFVERMTNQVLDFGKKTMDTFAIEPVTTGFNEYELKMGAVQTIMASTGATIGEVNGYLNELNKYSDKTIYSFSDMTNNIGKFTNAGVGLKDAVAAIQGISNEAALAGANAQEASRAMYNFAQALSSGSVKLIDWKSIENANMATVEFKNELLKTAEEMGTVARTADGMYKVLTTNAGGSGMKQVMDATANFNDSLQYQWMTSEVLVETLKRYADEEEEIGKKAFAAAQDVKTFSMMVDTLKEAAQSGWAETWEYVAGDFEQAKELWTGMTETFSKIIEGAAEARNKLIGNAMALQDDKGITGRMALWEGITNILHSVISALGAVKKGFEDIFPPMTDQQLRMLIERFKQWSEALKNDEERLDKIRRTFRGIFAVIDIFIMLIRKAFQISTTVIKAFVNFGANAFMAIAGWFIMWGEKIDTATSGFNGWLRGIRDGVREFIEYIEKLEGGFTIENLFAAFGAFGEKVIGKIFDFSWVQQSFDNFINKCRGLFNNLEENTEESSSTTMKLVSNLIQFLIKAKDKILDLLVRVTGSVTPEQVLAVGIGLALLLLIKTFSNFTSSLSRLADSVTDVFERVDKTMAAFSTRLKSEAVWNFAKSIGVVVASLALLTGLDQDNLMRCTIILGAIAVGLAGLSIAMSKLSGNAKQTLTFTSLIVGFSASLLLLSKALDTIQGMKFDDNINQSLTILASLAAGLVIVGKLLGSESKVFAVSAISMVGFVLSLKMLIDVFDDLTKRNLTGTHGALKTLIGLFGAMSLLGKTVGKINIGLPLTIVSLVLGVKVLLGAMDTLNSFDEQAINSSLTAIIKIFGTFAVLIAAMSLANIRITSVEEITEDSKKKSTKSADSIKQVGNAILKMSAALVVVGGAIAIFSKFSDEDLAKSESIILKLFGVFAALTAISALSGGNADKAGKMIARMSGSILAISALVAVLTLFDDPEVLKKPLRLIEELFLVMGAVVALSGLAGADKDVGKTVTMMTAGVVALSIMIAVMTGLDSDGVKNAAFAIAAVTGAFALLVASTGMAKKARTTVVLLTAVVAALALVVTKMDGIQNGIKNAGALAILVTALAGAMAILGKAKPLDKDVVKSLADMSLVVGILAGVLSIMSLLNTSVDITTAASLGALFVALSASFKIIGSAKAPAEGAMKSLAIMTGIFGGFGILLGWLSNPNINIQASLTNAAMIGILALSLSEAMKILSKAEGVSNDTVKQVAALGVAVTAIGMMIGLMNEWNLTPSLSTIGSLSLMLLSLIAALKLLQGVEPMKASVEGSLSLLGLVMGEIQLIVGALQRAGFEVGIENAASLTIMLVGLSKAAEFAANAGKVGFLNGLKGIGIISIFMLAAGALMGAIVWVVKKYPTINTDLDTAIEIMGKIGTGIGAAIGGIVGGFIGGIAYGALVTSGAAIASFIETIGGAVDTISKVPSAGFDNLKALASSMLALGAAEVMDALAWFLTLGNGGSMSDFKTQAEALGDGLLAFSNKAAEINNTSGIDTAVDVLNKLVEASKNVPKTGGWLQAIMGEHDATKFGEGMSALIDGIEAFNDNTKGFTKSDGFDAAIEVMKALAAASQEIPNSGGLLGDLVGNNNMAPWAIQMPFLAAGLMAFCTQVSDIGVTDGAAYAITIMKLLAAAAKEIPNTGGLLGTIVGNNDMGDWGTQMGTIGEGIGNFCRKTNGIPTGSVDAAIDVMGKLYTFSQGVGSVIDAGAVKIFGDAIISLGEMLYTYSTYIEKIENFDNFKNSATVISSLANMAKTVDNTNLKDLSKFGEELVNFAKNALKDFDSVFEKADMFKTGVSLGTKVSNGLKSTAYKFKIAVVQLTNNVLAAFDNQTSVLRQKGETLGAAVAAGLARGMSHSESSVTRSSRSLAGKVVPTMANTLQTHSPSLLTTLLGNYTGEGLANGIEAKTGRVQSAGRQIGAAALKGVEEGLGGLSGSLTGVFDNASSLYEKGIGKFKDTIQKNGLLNMTAEGGDFLTSARDKVKSWLGFDNSKGFLDMFGFGDIGEQFESIQDDITGGIASGIGGAASTVGSGGGGVGSAMDSLSEQLSLAMHEHFDFEPYAYLGKQIGQNMIISMSGEIVKETDEIVDTMKTVAEIAAEGIDQWKAWSEARQAYGKISDAELLAGWKVLQEKYKEGTKERMEADKQVYALQKTLVSSTYEFIKKQIETEKYYERLTLEEELAIWENATKMYQKESEQRIEIEKEVYRIKKELREKDYQDAVKDIERRASLNQLDVQGQIGAYTSLLTTYSDLSSHKTELEDKIYDLEQSRYAEAKKQISHMKKMDQLTKAQELAAYQALYSLVKKGSDEWLELEEEVYALQKEINKAQEDHAKSVADAEEAAQKKRIQAEEEYAANVKKVEEQLAKDIADLNKNYEDAVNARAKELYNSWGIFDAVKDSDYDGTVLLENIEYQVETFEDWQKEINKLIARGVDKTLIEELRAMGPQAVEQLRALNRLTDEQLVQYQNLWKQKTELARKQAVSELEYLKIDTQNKIAELRATAAKELEGYRQTWQTTMNQINSDLKASLAEIKNQFADLTTSINNGFNSIATGVEQTTQRVSAGAAKWSVMVKEADGTMRPANANDYKPGGVYSQSDLWNNTMRDLGVGSSSGGSSKPSISASTVASSITKAVGGSSVAAVVAATAVGTAISAGLSKGISSGTSSVSKAASTVAKAAVSSVKTATRVRSPSKVMWEIGEYCTKGFVQGLLVYVPQAFDAGTRIGNSLTDGVASAGVYLQELLDDELNLDPHIVPVLELDDLQNGFEDFNDYMDRSPVQIATDALKGIDSNNSYKDQARNTYLESLLGGIKEELGTLGDRIDGMQMVMDSGALVGQIVSPLDSELGNMVGRASRERV